MINSEKTVWPSLDKVWWWLRWRFLVLAVAYLCALVAFEAGVAVTDRPGVPDAGTLTHMYYALGLFVLGGMDLGVPTGGPTWARILLWMAYFGCPAITVSAVAEGLVRAINPQAWALRRIKDHIVIGGGGRLTRLYLAKLRQIAPNVPVIIVETQQNELSAEDAQKQYGALVVYGDISNPAVLAGLRLEQAQRLMLMTGNDFTNMEAASKVGQSHPELAENTVLHVSDITMLRLLESSRVLSDASIFNSHRIAAGHLVHTRLLSHFERTEPTDLVVIAGFGRFGQTILDELQRTAAGCFKTVIIIDTCAEYHAAVFKEQIGFSDNYRCEVLQGDMADPSMWERAETLFDEGIQEPVFVLGSSDDGNNIRVALWLTGKFPGAYTVALSFRQSTFAHQISSVCNFDVVSAEDLISNSMPTGWFKGRSKPWSNLRLGSGTVPISVQRDLDA